MGAKCFSSGVQADDIQVLWQIALFFGVTEMLKITTRAQAGFYLPYRPQCSQKKLNNVVFFGRSGIWDLHKEEERRQFGVPRNSVIRMTKVRANQLSWPEVRKSLPYMGFWRGDASYSAQRVCDGSNKRDESPSSIYIYLHWLHIFDTSR